MSNKKRTASQAAKDKAALKRLQKSGTYRGKIDLRKAPTKYQLGKIAELKAKNSRKPKATPPNVSKRGKQPLPPKQKVPGAKIKRSRMTEKEVRNLPPVTSSHKLTTYALPFLRKGQDEPEWRRFTRSQLTKFLNEYKADDPEGKAQWRSYAVKEEWTFETKTEKQDFARQTDLYFSGVRISEPAGEIKKRLVRKKKTAKKGGK